MQNNSRDKAGTSRVMKGEAETRKELAGENRNMQGQKEKSWTKELFCPQLFLREDIRNKSRIRETPTLLTYADIRTNTNLKRL